MKPEKQRQKDRTMSKIKEMAIDASFLVKEGERSILRTQNLR